MVGKQEEVGRVPTAPGSRASTEPVASPVSAASGFDPSRGVSLLASVVVALMRDEPDGWDDSKRFSRCLAHRRSGMEISFYDWAVVMREPETIRFGMLDSWRLKRASRHAYRTIAERRERERCQRLASKLAGLRPALVPLRQDGGSNA